VNSEKKEGIIEQKNKISLEVILNNIALYLWILVFFYLFSLINLYKYLPEINSVNYLWAFLVWIIASLSTCLAITWWIIIWFSRYFGEKSWIWENIKTQILFQVWRIWWFFILGWILWYIWNIFKIWYTISWILTFIVWFILLYLGLNIIWILPNITKFWFHLPKSFALKIEKIKNPKYALIIWALTFFLPCWFTQSIQLLAVNSWTFIGGWLIMLFFALWTTPVLFSVWLGSSYFKEKRFPLLNNAIWIFVILFWIVTITNSYNLINFRNMINNENEVVNVDNNISNKEIETVNVSHNWWSVEPKTINLKKWWNYKIIITPTKNWLGCMTTQLIPKLNSKVSYVQKWLPIIYDIINAKVWTYDIVCSAMWMEQGKIVVN
jgi:sulfite exporter TauE/SafE